MTGGGFFGRLFGTASAPEPETRVGLPLSELAEIVRTRMIEPALRDAAPDTAGLEPVPFTRIIDYVIPFDANGYAVSGGETFLAQVEDDTRGMPVWWLISDTPGATKDAVTELAEDCLGRDRIMGELIRDPAHSIPGLVRTFATLRQSETLGREVCLELGVNSISGVVEIRFEDGVPFELDKGAEP